MHRSEKRPTAKEIYDLGKEFCVTSTVDKDFIPEFRPGLPTAMGAKIWGQLANSSQPARWFLDFFSGVGVNNLGYGNPQIKRVAIDLIESGLSQFPGNDFYNEHAVLLCQKLCQITPGHFPKKAFLCNSGTEAVEAALKLSIDFWSRQKGEYRRRVVAFQGGFHGRTLGSLSLNASKEKHIRWFFKNCSMSSGTEIKERAVPVTHLPFPEINNPEKIQDFYLVLSKLYLTDTLAVVLELVQGEGGIRVIDPDALQVLVEKCKRTSTHLIVDEVQTGFMRTGKMFACQHYNLQPDIICLAKALSGGVAAIGATVARSELDFQELGRHSNTFGGGPLVTACALAFIEELEKINLAQLNKKIKVLTEFAPEGLGMMRRINFTSPQVRDLAVANACKKGLLVIGAGTSSIRLMPPLIISMQDLQKGINILKSCIV